MIILFIIIVYIGFMYPGKRRESDILKVDAFAHRGFHGKGIPENSMKAFKRAKELGYGIELDVQLTKDEVMVVHHDYHLNRTCGEDKVIADLTYEELMEYSLMGTDEKIPRFVDVLNEIDGQVPLLIELKMEECNKRLCQLSARALDKYEGMYCMESFHPYALYWYKTHRPEVIRGQLGDQFYKEDKTDHPIAYWIMSNLLTNWLTKPDFIAYRYKYSQCIPVKICRQIHKMPVYGWTIREKSELNKERKHLDGFIFERFMI